jgi:hypothetical protein
LDPTYSATKVTVLEASGSMFTWIYDSQRRQISVSLSVISLGLRSSMALWPAAAIYLYCCNSRTQHVRFCSWHHQLCPGCCRA